MNVRLLHPHRITLRPWLMEILILDNFATMIIEGKLTLKKTYLRKTYSFFKFLE